MRTTWASIIARPFWLLTGWILRAPERIEKVRKRKAQVGRAELLHRATQVAKEAHQEGYRAGHSEGYHEGYRDAARIHIRDPAELRYSLQSLEEREKQRRAATKIVELGPALSPDRQMTERLRWIYEGGRGMRHPRALPSEHGPAHRDPGRDRRVSSGDLGGREDRPAPRPPDEGASR